MFYNKHYNSCEFQTVLKISLSTALIQARRRGRTGVLFSRLYIGGVFCYYRQFIIFFYFFSSGYGVKRGILSSLNTYNDLIYEQICILFNASTKRCGSVTDGRQGDEKSILICF